MKKNKQEEFAKKWAQVVAKAWTDEKFKEKLLKNPEKVLAEMGIAIPAGQKIEIHAGTERVMHLVLPQKPEGALTEQDLVNIAGGSCTGSAGCGPYQRCGK